MSDLAPSKQSNPSGLGTYKRRVYTLEQSEKRSFLGVQGGSGLSKSHNTTQPLSERLDQARRRASQSYKPFKQSQNHYLKLYRGGRLAEVKLMSTGRYQESEVKCDHTRGKITTWSKKSQHRFKLSLAKLRQDKLSDGLEITLTYPKVFPNANDHETYKRHLLCFNLWLRRRNMAGAWKLEFQSRGAPHFHILALPKTKLKGLSKFRKELAEYWYKLVDSKDEKHLKAGTSCGPIESSEGIISYMAQYLGKEDQILPDNFTGRYWGYFSKPDLPWTEETSISVGKVNACKIRRLFRTKIIKDQEAKSYRIIAKVLQGESSINTNAQELRTALFRLAAKSPTLSKNEKKIQAAYERNWFKLPKKWRLRNNQVVRLFCDPDQMEADLKRYFAREKRNLTNGGYLP